MDRGDLHFHLIEQTKSGGGVHKLWAHDHSPANNGNNNYGAHCFRGSQDELHFLNPLPHRFSGGQVPERPWSRFVIFGMAEPSAEEVAEATAKLMALYHRKGLMRSPVRSGNAGMPSMGPPRALSEKSVMPRRVTVPRCAPKLPARFALEGTIPIGEKYRVHLARAQFRRWPGLHGLGGQQPDGRIYNKNVLEDHGAPSFGELVVLNELKAAGWCGVEVEAYYSGGNFRGRPWRDHWDFSLAHLREQPSCALPPELQSAWNRIYAANGNRIGGWWDIFAWKDGQHLFVECKAKTRTFKDAIRGTQVKWLESARAAGFPIESFVVLEWSL